VTAEPLGSPELVVPTFTSLLDLRQTDGNVFEGYCAQARPGQAFGGHVAAQALVAAGRTVPPDRPAHSLHCYFIRPGRVDSPVSYLVDRTRDGRSFTTRHVTAEQHGKTIFSMIASFQRPRGHYDRQDRGPDLPPIPAASDRLDWRPPGMEEHPAATSDRVIDVRLADRQADEGRVRMWLRIRDRLDDAALSHAGALAYLSDLNLALTATLPYPDGSARPITSLDHALWIHRPFRADDWLLASYRSPVAFGSRGLTTGEYHDQAGQLVASVTQEVLFPADR
jgi:acyl-CoA thioesterase II